MNLASEVSAMETELDTLRAELQVLRGREIAQNTEIGQLQQTVSRLQAERDTLMRRGEALKSILDQTGSGLVNAMRTYHAAEREVQQQALGVGQDDLPKFLSNGHKVLQDTLN